MGKNLQYDTDTVKHYVRLKGWLKEFKTIKNATETAVRKKKTRKQRCKYFTFCAVNAIDVFLFEKEKLLYRDPKTKRLLNVYFCENDIEAYGKIQQLIGSGEQAFFGNFQEIMLQDLTDIKEDSESEDEMEEEENEEERRIGNLKQRKLQIIEAFPFDIINLDLYGNFFPKNQNRYSDYVKAFEEILIQQKACNDNLSIDRFLMFLTVHTPISEDDFRMDVSDLFTGILQMNFMYDKFEQAFKDRFGHNSPKELETHMKFVLGFTKQIIFFRSFACGWYPVIKDIYCYDRRKNEEDYDYKMTCFVIEFQRKVELDSQEGFTNVAPKIVQEDYVTQLELILEKQPHNVPNSESIEKEVLDDLKATVEFRNNFLESIGIEDIAQFID